eukprot:11220240-Lingulodinium_polyedra.AAC.1
MSKHSGGGGGSRSRRPWQRGEFGTEPHHPCNTGQTDWDATSCRASGNADDLVDNVDGRVEP